MSVSAPHVVVVAYHAPAALDRCLAALDRALPTTVVDNSSSPEVEAIVRRHGARYVDASANRGFAAGANIGLRLTASDGSDALLLNPDAVITAEAVDALSRHLHSSEGTRVAALAPALRNAAGTYAHLEWPFPSPVHMWAEALGLRFPTYGTFVIGAVLLLRRKAIDQVGEFDERFFLYAEETDWQWRASKLGWDSAVCPDVVAEHVGAGTSTDERRREILFHAAQETYIRKWYGEGGWRSYRAAACLGAGARALALRGERRAQAARRARLYAQGPCRVAAGLD